MIAVLVHATPEPWWVVPAALAGLIALLAAAAAVRVWGDRRDLAVDAAVLRHPANGPRS